MYQLTITFNTLEELVAFAKHPSLGGMYTPETITNLQEGEPVTTNEAPAPPTEKDAESTAREYASEHGAPALVKKLQRFGVARVSELPEDKVEAFVVELEGELIQ
jgi:hypothetical protein